MFGSVDLDDINGSIPPIPRVYPRAFAERIRRLFDKFVKGGEGQPQQKCSAIFGGPDAFSKCPWSDWKEARLFGSMRYLRGNKHLDVPIRWKEVFPQPFEMLHRVEQRQPMQNPASQQCG